MLLVLLAQAAGAQSPEDGRNALDPQRGAARDLGLSQVDDERDPSVLRRIVMPSDSGLSPSEISEADDIPRGSLEPRLPRMITGTEPGPSPSEISEADDSAHRSLEPRLPRMMTATEPGP